MATFAIAAALLALVAVGLARAQAWLTRPAPPAPRRRPF